MKHIKLCKWNRVLLFYDLILIVLYFTLGVFTCKLDMVKTNLVFLIFFMLSQLIILAVTFITPNKYFLTLHIVGCFTFCIPEIGAVLFYAFFGYEYYSNVIYCGVLDNYIPIVRIGFGIILAIYLIICIIMSIKKTTSYNKT